MVSNQIKLNKIFDSVNNESFVVLTMVSVGDFFQHAPVGGKPVCSIYKNN